MGNCVHKKSRKERADENQTLTHQCQFAINRRHLWIFVHSLLVTIPDKASRKYKDAIWTMLASNGTTLPCKMCRTFWRVMLSALDKHKNLILSDAASASSIFFDLHNIYNAQQGKPMLSFSDFQQKYNVRFSKVNIIDTITKDDFDVNQVAVPVACDTSNDSRTSVSQDDAMEIFDLVNHQSAAQEGWDV